MKKKKVKIIAGALAVLLIISATYVGFAFFGGAFRVEGETFLYIDGDDNIDSVYTKLAEQAKTKRLSEFKLMAGRTSYADNIRPGRYRIAPGLSIFKLFRQLKNGAQTPLRLTIPSVRTKEKLAAYLGEKMMVDSAEIALAMDDAAADREIGLDADNIICLFIPNTYEIYWTTPAEGIVKRMKKEYDAFWSQRSKKAANMGMTPSEVMTLASIVDEETANNAEKPMVAGMYINRLNANMPLQADPTIKYALGQFELKRIYHNMLSVNSPYNTYKNTGLPPGPIRIPTVAGIDAVLNHVRHNYMYMCAKEDFSGTHNFAVTYNEHLANARKYSEALERNGIK